MFTAEQYRNKAIEYSKLIGIASAPNKVHELQRLGRSFAELADNAQWVTDNRDKMVHARELGGVGALGSPVPYYPLGSF